MCAGLEAGIEGDTNDIGQRRVERVRTRRGDGEIEVEEATVEPEEEATEGLEASLEMEVEEGVVRERKVVEVL